MLRRLLLASGVVVALAALGGGAVFTAVSRYNAPGPLPATQALVVPHGTPAAVAEALHSAGVVSLEWPLRLAVLLTTAKGPLHAGEFTFPAHASLFATLTILRNGRPVQHKLTIPEGLTAAQTAYLLDRAPALDGDTPMPDEGEMLPETYAYEFGTTRTALLDRAKTAMDHALSQAWEGRRADLPLASATEMLTLASIVERETARPEERPHIAAVFLNRLRLKMKLQSDPTTAYAVSGGLTTNDRGLTRADLDSANPYNTYFIPGLPPGPIGSPGLAALQAVANPMASDDLYFVSDGAGGHLFARTLEEHNRNVARWRMQNARK